MEAPKYEVIADYPKSPFAVGDILNLEKSAFSNGYIYLIFTSEGKDWMTENEFDYYPNIFKKL